MNNIDIIIPTRNESGNVRELIERLDSSLKKAGITYTVIFVDFQSTDQTEQIINQLAQCFPVTFHQQNSRGKAMAILEGVAFASSDYAVMMDADLQYPPEAIPEMFKLIGTYDVVVAKREVNNERFLRKILSKAHRYVFGKLLFGLSCDIQSGLKMFPRTLADDIDRSDITAWTLDLSLLLAAQRRNYRIGEVPIAFAERRFGQSKVSIVRSIYEHVYTSLRLKWRELHK